MTALLDANVLIALVVSDHVHHEPAEDWLSSTSGGFATSPMTQGSLVRLLVRQGQTVSAVKQVIDAIAANRRHEFWSDTVSFADVKLTGVVGRRQVTDAYLAQLARTRNGRLVTFDQGLAQLHNDVAELIPTT
ncbi:TA system VapC family ribonuclease toxin [Mycobacterium celatum]|uniref:Ribonuclease VapC n=1 Tax=Mycobacterium celatum TaxID=28045 RepID=A0A1X1RPE8_MYCCE|nr:TA system VapC family ribonuclease toxin [Mycobacterium celatum]ORV10889.1 ribonuclease [Mycobacterium celatum]PIB79495.1 VapC toxin family PIN domain ribonuclease [Mycobacterium celatum]